MVRFLIAGLIAALSISAFAGTTVRAQDSTLAGDHSEVIAQGVDSLPGGSMAWRVVRDSAEPIGQAGFEERALGFAIATDGTLLLTDDNTGARTLLQPGEAAFTSEGTLQARESTTDASTSYLRVALVDASEANNGNGDEVVYGGSGFATLAGDYEIELIGVKLAPNESTQLPATANSLVFVSEGSVTAGSETIDAGAATTIAGPVQLQAGDMPPASTWPRLAHGSATPPPASSPSPRLRPPFRRTKKPQAASSSSPSCARRRHRRASANDRRRRSLLRRRSRHRYDCSGGEHRNRRHHGARHRS